MSDEEQFRFAEVAWFLSAIWPGEEVPREYGPFATRREAEEQDIWLQRFGVESTGPKLRALSLSAFTEEGLRQERGTGEIITGSQIRGGRDR